MYSPWNSPGQNTGVGSFSLLQGINLGIELKSPTLQADSLPAEPQRKPKNTGVSSRSLLQRIVLTEESNQGFLHCRQILNNWAMRVALGVSVQLLSRIRLFATPWIAARQASLSITNSRSPPNPLSIESVMPSNHLIHPTISSSVVPFSSCPQSFPASGSFPVSQLFTSGGQSIGVSVSTSVPPMNTQDWSPLGWTGWCILAGIIAIKSGTKCPPKDQSNIKESKVSIFSGSLLWLFVSFSIMFLLPPIFITYTIGLPMGTGNAALSSVCVICQREWERVGHITCTEDAICSTNHNGFNCIICYSFLQTLFYSTGNSCTKRGKKLHEALVTIKFLPSQFIKWIP